MLMASLSIVKRKSKRRNYLFFHEESGHFFARDRGGSLKRLHRPNRFRVRLPELEGGRVDIHVMTNLDPGYP